MPYILETVKTKKTVHVRKYYTYRFYSKGEKRRKKEKASTEKMIQRINPPPIVPSTLFFAENFIDKPPNYILSLYSRKT